MGVHIHRAFNYQSSCLTQKVAMDGWISSKLVVAKFLREVCLTCCTHPTQSSQTFHLFRTLLIVKSPFGKSVKSAALFISANCLLFLSMKKTCRDLLTYPLYFFSFQFYPIKSDFKNIFCSKNNHANCKKVKLNHSVLFH